MQRPILVAAVTVALFSSISCSRSGATDGARGVEGAIKTREKPRVIVELVSEREMQKKLDTTTKVESEHQVEVIARVGGVLMEVLAEEGDRVQDGQVLARLDAREAKIASTDAEVAFEEAKANLPKLELAVREAESRVDSAKHSSEQAQRDYERSQNMAKGGSDRPKLVSEKDLEQSRLLRDTSAADLQNVTLAFERARIDYTAGKTAIDRAQLVLDRARLTLSYTELRAPFAGVIAQRWIKVGDTLGMSTVAFTLTDPDSLRVVFYRPQRELALFHGVSQESTNGQGVHALELSARAEALPGRIFRGTIERIAPTIDPQSGAFRVTARLQPTAEGDPNAHLLAGMLIRVEIITERRAHARVAPKRAILREGEVSRLVVVRDGRAQHVTVEEGLSDDDYVEVQPLSGSTLELGEPIVVVGNRDLEDGTEVLIETPKVAPGESK